MKKLILIGMCMIILVSSMTVSSGELEWYKNYTKDLIRDCYEEIMNARNSCNIPKTAWSGCEGKEITFCSKINGTSMLPFIDSNKKLCFCNVDILRVGDIVMIETEEYRQYDWVLHRIVGFNGTRVITQGYNNNKADTYYAKFYEIRYELGSVEG